MRNVQKPGLPHFRDFPSNVELWYPLNLHHIMQMGSCIFFPGEFRDLYGEISASREVFSSRLWQPRV